MPTLPVQRRLKHPLMQQTCRMGEVRALKVHFFLCLLFGCSILHPFWSLELTTLHRL